MFDRVQVEKLLVLNGVEPTAPDEEIRSVLIEARWDHDDVNAALSVLRENTATHETHVDTFHKVFRSDQRLKPSTISALLGIDLDLTDADVSPAAVQSKKTVSAGQKAQMILVTLCLTGICTVGLMWFMKVGLFHHTAV